MDTRLNDRSWIQCHSGRPFWPLDPRPEDVDINDIAWALSHICRFTGHTKTFYSVAEHSIRVSFACDPKDAVWAIVHDASEAYLCDLPRPLKILPAFEPYRRAEAAVMRAICQRYDLSVEMPASVHVADMRLLATEARDLMGDPEWGRALGVEPLVGAAVEPMGEREAREWFLGRFHRMTGGRFDGI